VEWGLLGSPWALIMALCKENLTQPTSKYACGIEGPELRANPS